MSNLRMAGLVIGILGLLLTFRIYRGPRWRRLNFILSGSFSLFLIALCVRPDLLNTLAGMLALQREQRGRILALLIFSNIFLWFALLYSKTRLDEYKHQFDLLVRNLGNEETRVGGEGKIRNREVLIVIPAYNEAENLKRLLADIPDEIEGKKAGVIVVDDASSDDTARVVKEAGDLLVRNRIHRGGGAALRLGYDVAKNIGPEIVVTMDADGQHDPREIARLLKPILEDKCDFVIGSRVLGKWEKDSRFRFVGLHVFNHMINLLLGTKITDCSSGFRAFKVDLLASVTLGEDQYHTSELIIDAVKKGIRIGEVPVTILKRKHGRSKKGKDWKYGLHFAKATLKTWWR